MFPLLNILIVEDCPADIDLMLYEIRKAGYEIQYKCAETEEEYLNGLGELPDLILADYTLPQFNGMRALELLNEKSLEIPFILISGTIDEEVAVRAIKKGAADYILKDRLARLGLAVQHALASKKLRLEKRVVELSLQESEAKFRSLVQQAMEGIVLVNNQGEIVEWNKGMEIITGITREQAIGNLCWDVQFQTSLPSIKTKQRYQYLRDIYLQAFDLQDAYWFRHADVQEILRTDGMTSIIEGLTFPVISEKSFWLCSVIRDVTGHVRAVQESRHQAERAEALIRLALELNSNLDLDSVLNLVCKESSLALQAPIAIVMLYDAANNQLVQRAILNLTNVGDIYVPPIPLPVFDSHVPDDKPVIINKILPSENEWGFCELDKKSEAKSAVFLRMNHDRRFIGVLAVYTFRQPSEISRDEISLVKSFVSQAAVAISNAWLFEQVRKGRDNLQALSRRLVEVQEEERRSIARELHDEIGQALTGLKILYDTHPDPMAESLQMARSLVTDLIQRTRKISLDLRPSMLDDLGLLPALLWHIERCKEQSLLEVDFKHSGLNQRFSQAIETAAYRIIQEGCTNIIRHSITKKAIVRVWVEEDTLHIQVEDKGVGFDSQVIIDSGLGGGLSGMRERVVLIGGSFEIHSQPSKGTTIIARLPLQERLERRGDLRSILPA